MLSALNQDTVCERMGDIYYISINPWLQGIFHLAAGACHWPRQIVWPMLTNSMRPTRTACHRDCS